MKRTLIVLVAVLAAMTASVRGEAASRTALATELVNILKIPENTDKSFVNAKKSIPTQMEQLAKKAGLEKVPPVVASKAEEIVDIMSSALSWSKIKNDTIAIFAEVYSESELKSAIAFFKSAEGQSYLSKQQELNHRMQEMNQKTTAKIAPRIQQINQEINQEVSKAVRQGSGL